MLKEVKNAQIYNQNQQEQTADRLKVTYYTDPLCCWSWAFEPHWNRFRTAFADRIDCDYIMGGMIPDWTRYDDPLNSVSRPFQMGPVWMHAGQITHTKINFNIWHEDPPSSSYPSCIAVKCASLQSRQAEDLYLKSVREAVMLQGLNVAKTAVLMNLANELETQSPALFDAKKFITDWNNGTGRNAFRVDLQQAAYHKIGRFPTLTFVNAVGKGVMITGYRPYEELEKVMAQLTPMTAKTN